ncbi:MAG: helix-turn-helix domain-containing protein, partial [Clostridia bacterium]|nr:helix-turn-helix domain-containing protein [Clostridia bacterium]
MSNRYLKVGEVAELWKVSERRVQLLCDQGRIEGAKKFGRSWMIPDDAPKPVDTRYKEQKKMLEDLPTLPMPRKAPFLDMTDLYTKPGSADEVIESLADHPEAQALFAAEIAYSRGEIGKVMEHAQYFLKAKSGFYAVNAGGMLLALAAMWRGDILLW